MTKNIIYNEDALVTMSRLKKEIDVVITSPPFNTSRVRATDKHSRRYDLYLDSKPEEEYIKWTIEIFNGYDKILKADGVVLYNLSYAAVNPALVPLVVADVIRNTNFTVADCIVWKKPKAMPSNKSHNRLTRVVELIYVFCRKTEINTFKTNKQVVSYDIRTGQKNYQNLFNYIEARNNDGSNELNKATFSSELVMKLLDMYASDHSAVVYDSFAGIGTTAKAALKKRLVFVGSEISAAQVESFNSYKANIPAKESKNYKIDRILNKLNFS